MIYKFVILPDFLKAVHLNFPIRTVHCAVSINRLIVNFVILFILHFPISYFIIPLYPQNY